MLLPWAKPMPIASAQNCQRAWKELRKANSRRARKPRGQTPSGGEQTRPMSGRKRTSMLEIVLRGQHVGIGEHDPLMPRRLPALETIVELGVGADRIVADQQAAAPFGLLDEERADQGNDRIGLLLDAEQHFVIGIIEFEGRAQSLFGKGLQAAERAARC